MSIDKKTIREQLLEQRNKLSLSVQRDSAKIIIEKILALPVFESAKSIALYHAFRNEVNLDALWHEAVHLNKKTFFPVINTNKNIKTMHFSEALPQDLLKENHFRIKEPTSEPVDLAILDCLFIPLVGFDKAGFRLGMGQGYYDRMLADLRKINAACCLIGIAYDFQYLTELPHDPWDIPLDMVVTEKQIYSAIF